LGDVEDSQYAERHGDSLRGCHCDFSGRTDFSATVSRPALSRMMTGVPRVSVCQGFWFRDGTSGRVTRNTGLWEDRLETKLTYDSVVLNPVKN
jgi:hypothetical protein